MKYINVILSLFLVCPIFSFAMDGDPGVSSPKIPSRVFVPDETNTEDADVVIDDIVDKLERIRDYKLLTDPLDKGQTLDFLGRLIDAFKNKTRMHKGIVFSILTSKKYREKDKQNSLKIFISLLDGLFKRGYTQKFINYMDVISHLRGKIRTTPLLLSLDLGYIGIAKLLIKKRACLLTRDSKREGVLKKAMNIDPKNNEEIQGKRELLGLITKFLKMYKQADRVRFLNGESLPNAQYSTIFTSASSLFSSSIGTQTESVEANNSYQYSSHDDERRTGYKRDREEDDKNLKDPSHRKRRKLGGNRVESRPLNRQK